MDAEKWLIYVGGPAVLAVLGAVFGPRTWKRQKSSDGVADAEDTVSRNYVGNVEKREEAATQRLELERQTSERLREELAGMRERAAADRMKVRVLLNHTLTLTRIVVEHHPAEAKWARESEFMALFDDSQPGRHLKPRKET